MGNVSGENSAKREKLLRLQLIVVVAAAAVVELVVFGAHEGFVEFGPGYGPFFPGGFGDAVGLR